MLGVFMALDLFLFYVMWEVMLVPMYFIIGVWGGDRRIYASLKFFLYTMVGSLLMLVAIVYLGLAARSRITGIPNFGYDAVLAAVRFSPATDALAVRRVLPGVRRQGADVPVPHLAARRARRGADAGLGRSWRASCSSSERSGSCGCAVPLFPAAATDPTVRGILLTLAVIGIVYGALVALVQPDFKKLVAYSSVSHLGFVMLGIFALTVQSVQGALMVMINHGISTGALFFLVGMIYERRHTRLIDDYGGLARVVPMFSAAAHPRRAQQHRRAGHQRVRGRVPRAVGSFRVVSGVRPRRDDGRDLLGRLPAVGHPAHPVQHVGQARQRPHPGPQPP